MEEDKLPSKKHVQVPNDMTKSSKLEPRDALVYATIKKYVDYKTNETFVGLETIAKDSGYTIPTVRKSIDILKTNGYIEVNKQGRSNLYKFNKYKNFEPFSYEFLNGEKIEASEKAYLLVAQQYMFKDIEGVGKVTLDNNSLGEKINLSPRTIQKLDKSLIEKGYLNIVKTSAKNLDTGLKINEKIFHLNELEQAVIWTLQKHDEKINEHENRLLALEKQLSIALKENAELKKDINKQNTNDDLLVL
jgi:DNA-binding MarR family transcriptional regulator